MGSGMTNQTNSDKSQSPLSFPSDSPFMGSHTFGDPLIHSQYQKFQSATPLVQSRPLNQIAIKNDILGQHARPTNTNSPKLESLFPGGRP